MPQPTSTRRAIVIASALYLASILGVFGDVMLSGSRVLSKDDEDLATIFLHWQQFDARELGHGRFPLWNPHVFSGTPYFGAFQPALAYPPAWLGIFMPPTVALNVDIALHFFIGALGTFLWAMRRRLHPVACFAAGFVFTFCGAHFLQVYRGHVPNLRTLVWAPWILLAIDGVSERPASAWTLLGMAAVAMQILAGHVQEAFYTALAAGAYAILAWMQSGRRAGTALALVAIYGGGAALAAVQLFAGYAAVAESAHTRLSYRFAAAFSFPPENLLTLVLPGFFGALAGDSYWGRWTLSEMSLFVGCAPFLLALYAAVAGDHATRRFSLTLAIVTFVFACGAYTPLFRVLYAWVPGFASFRGTTKFTFLTMLFVAMLAGIGVDMLLVGRGPARWMAVVAITLGVALAIAGAVVLVSAPSGPQGAWGRVLGALDLPDDAFNFRYYPVTRGAGFVARSGAAAGRSLLAAAATFLVVAALWMGARRRRSLAYLIVAIGCAELLVYARSTRPSFDASDRLRAAENLAAFMRASGGDARTGNAPYFAMSAGTRDIWGDDPMVLRRYAEFVATTQGRDPNAPDQVVLETVSSRFSLVRLRYLFRRTGARMRASASDLPELPRATLVSDWRVVTDRDQRLALLAQPGFEPTRTVILEGPPDPLPSGDASGGSATVVDVSTDVMDVLVDAPAATILLLGENYSAGWRAVAAAESSQTTYTIMPADHFLQAIPLAAGTHHFRLEYRPREFVWGSYVTAASVVTYVVTAMWMYRRRGAVAAPAP